MEIYCVPLKFGMHRIHSRVVRWHSRRNEFATKTTETSLSQSHPNQRRKQRQRKTLYGDRNRDEFKSSNSVSPSPSFSSSFIFFSMDTTFSSFSATIFFFYALLLIPSSSGRIFDEFIFPNFTATNLRFVDNSGAFLSSPNATFTASICNPSSQSNFYLCVIHSKSNTIIWSANRNSPISNSDSMTLTQNGISITRSNGSLAWSTPPSPSPVSALRLLENGNLMLLDRYNASIWQSFDYPTDTVVMGQPIYVGRMLRSPVSDSDLSTGDYEFYVTSEDAVLQWESQDYWKLSMETRAFKNSNLEISFMEMNRSGLYLFNGNGSVVVWQMIFSSPSSDFVFAKLDYKGRFNVFLFSGTSQNTEFTAPADDCGLPNTCGEMGLCRDGLRCTCPSGFRASTTAAGGCVPSNGNGLSDCSSNSSSYSYMELADGTQYFANKFANPTTSRSDLNTCRDLCSKNCSCLGFFYTNSSGSCYLLRNRLGSVFTSSSNGDEEDLGYVKTVVNGSPTEATNSADLEKNSGGSLPIWALILIPCTVVFFLIILSSAAFLWWRRWRVSKTMTIKLGRSNSSSSTDFDPISIPGLPVRFKYEELESATNNFRIQIGSGGFGSVYKGTLPDKTVVAVKKISNIGVQGKKEFCTEIAVIGNIHHVNLVSLKGYCAQGMRRLLVYEYMNMGSLDRSLFGVGPVLEWQERLEIALGTARGLAYLHGGCEHKIIHCDIKPENILLHDHSQVKISDFGLSKLMTPEQSNLFTTMRGTRGYLAPEWLTNSAISDRTDVYSYGMVLLEITRGRKNCYLHGQGQVQVRSHGEESGESSSSSGSETDYFPLFALEMHEQGKYLELADPRLEGRVASEQVEKLVRIALCCVHEEPMLRPSMATVVAMLEGGLPLAEPRVESLNFLRFYGRRFTEPAMGEVGGENGFLYRVGTTSLTSSSSGTHAAWSYLSSQVVSGPR